MQAKDDGAREADAPGDNLVIWCDPDAAHDVLVSTQCKQGAEGSWGHTNGLCIREVSRKRCSNSAVHIVFALLKTVHIGKRPSLPLPSNARAGAELHARWGRTAAVSLCASLWVETFVCMHGKQISSKSRIKWQFEGLEIQ